MNFDDYLDAQLEVMYQDADDHDDAREQIHSCVNHLENYIDDLDHGAPEFVTEFGVDRRNASDSCCSVDGKLVIQLPYAAPDAIGRWFGLRPRDQRALFQAFAMYADEELQSSPVTATSNPVLVLDK